ncbi:MAG: hypothetical protein R2770_16095 [Acidimicrobiales bacterium]|nr:hypothetical protein [Acidimicrobiales bacterium]
MALDPQQRSRLHEAKLRSLARSQFDVELVESSGSESGAFGWSADRCFALIEGRPDTSLGRALGMARRRDSQRLDVLCQVGAGSVALRASLLDRPVWVWAVDGTAVNPANAAPVDVGAEPAPEALSLIPAIEAAGARPFVEHGVVLAEVRGLEVGRVEVDEFGPRLVVGVSVDDRMMNEIIHSNEPAEVTLARVVDLVEPYRLAGADPHPFNRLSRERLLRQVIMDDPSSVGFQWVSPAQPPSPRPNLADPCPAVALAGDGDEVGAVVVASVGVDLELVPFAAHARHLLAPSAELLVVVPERDAVSFTAELVGGVVGGARLVTVGNDWFAAAGL